MFETLLLIVTLCGSSGCDNYAIDVFSPEQANECEFRAGQLGGRCERASLEAGDYVEVAK